jgi:NTE family protein
MQTIGLVLSGGGVRGVAHLGVIQVLKEIGLEPSVISGTSAGALVGALYAAGHTIESMFDFFKNTSIFKIGNISASKPGFIDTDKFQPLLQEYLPEDDFAALQKKLYVTATDIIHGRVKTFSSGRLIKPLLASAAVPVVFTPVEIDGILYTDGGALNNFPVEPLSGQSDAIIGVDVHPLKETTPDNIRTSLGVMERIFHLTVHYHSVQKYHQCNVAITPRSLSEFGTFDRGRFEEIFEIGYKSAYEKRSELRNLLVKPSGNGM